jgi:hypothetical protein
MRFLAANLFGLWEVGPDGWGGRVKSCLGFRNNETNEMPATDWLARRSCYRFASGFAALFHLWYRLCANCGKSYASLCRNKHYGINCLKILPIDIVWVRALFDTDCGWRRGSGAPFDRPHGTGVGFGVASPECASLLRGSFENRDHGGWPMQARARTPARQPAGRPALQGRGFHPWL